MQQFKTEVLNNFYNDGGNRKMLEDFIKTNKPLNGAIVITKITESLKKYLGKDDEDLRVGSYMLGYQQIDTVEILDDTSCKFYKTLQMYKSLSTEDKNEIYFVLLEFPLDNDPSNCSKCSIISRGLLFKESVVNTVFTSNAFAKSFAPSTPIVL